MTKEEFLKLAGGRFESDLSWKHMRASEKKKHFWAFYSQSAKAIGVYSGVPLDQLLKKDRYSIEHILPKSYLLEALRDQPPTVRNGATVNPFNLMPAHRKLNRLRGDAAFDFDGDTVVRQFQVKFRSVHNDPIGYDADNQWHPPRKSRGDLARAILYMGLCYSLFCRSRHNIEELINWTRADAPSKIEVAYCKWVESKLGIRNPFVLHPELATDNGLRETLLAKQQS